MHPKSIPVLKSWLPALISLCIISCKKDNDRVLQPSVPAAMEYFNFNNYEIKGGKPGLQVDLNHDGRKDIAFSTQLVGDPLNQVDKLQFLVSSNIKVNLPVKTGEEVPVMHRGDSIFLNDFETYHWFELSSIVLVQKIISFTQPDFWEGHWKAASHRYLPFQIATGNNLYNGWIEISADLLNEKLIVHCAALSKDANKVVRAGF